MSCTLCNRLSNVSIMSGERRMGRQRREQRTAIDEEGPSPEGITDGKAVKGTADGHRRGRAESRAYQRRA